MIVELPTVATLSRAIAILLEAQDGADNFSHVYQPSERHVGRLGFVLEPTPDLYAWVQEKNLDALFVHRPWRLLTDALPESVGVVAYHQPFDAALAVGHNPRLADALGLDSMASLGEKEGLPLGMIGDIAPQSWETWEARVRHEFQGTQQVSPPRQTQVTRVAVMGAMNDGLVRDAFHAGADVYITGQMRAPGRVAVQETGIGVIAVGHACGEHWGLRKLASLLQEQYPALVTTVL